MNKANLEQSKPSPVILYGQFPINMVFTGLQDAFIISITI